MVFVAESITIKICVVILESEVFGTLKNIYRESNVIKLHCELI